jgi:hypothetical protein
VCAERKQRRAGSPRTSLTICNSNTSYRRRQDDWRCARATPLQRSTPGLGTTQLVSTTAWSINRRSADLTGPPDDPWRTT